MIFNEITMELKTISNKFAAFWKQGAFQFQSKNKILLNYLAFK